MCVCVCVCHAPGRVPQQRKSVLLRSKARLRLQHAFVCLRHRVACWGLRHADISACRYLGGPGCAFFADLVGPLVAAQWKAAYIASPVCRRWPAGLPASAKCQRWDLVTHFPNIISHDTYRNFLQRCTATCSHCVAQLPSTARARGPVEGLSRSPDEARASH